MKKNLFLLILLMLPCLAFAQFAVVSTQPANLAKNVPQATTISITFNEALDTNAMKALGDEVSFTSIKNVVSSGFTSDAKTMYANVVLDANQTYFMAFIYMKAISGAVITTPHVYHFTTGSDFPPYSVSGTVHSGTSGVSPERSIVALSTMSMMDNNNEGPPPFIAWANVNSNGTYTLPYVNNGVYWPIAAKDVNGDGFINPDNGTDVIALGDSIIVNNASLTDISMTFLNFSPMTFHDALTTADSLAKELPNDRLLHRVSGWDVDTLGRTSSWEFVYSFNGGNEGKIIRVGTFQSEIYIPDPEYFGWLKTMKPISNMNTAASSAAVIANVENAGGREIRLQHVSDTLRFRAEMGLSDQKNGWFYNGNPDYDTSKIYWAVAYVHTYRVGNQDYWVDGKFFLCDFSTGAVIKTQVMLDVNDQPQVPNEFVLYQNYPNPFNPATVINYQLPINNHVTLKVYDVLGKEVATLVNEYKEAGEHFAKFNAANLPSGIYFYRLHSGNFVETKKMVLLK